MGTLVIRGPEIPNLVARVTINRLNVFDDRTTNFKIHERFQTGFSVILGRDPAMEDYLCESVWQNPGKDVGGDPAMEYYLCEGFSHTTGA